MDIGGGDRVSGSGADAFAAQVHDLVATYLAEGQAAGLVAPGVTPVQAIDILVGGIGT